MHKTVLILGSNGRFGRHASNAFAEKGWEVRQFDRARDDLWDAAWGAEVIVNAWNLPYPDWADQLPKLTNQIIEVAKSTKATVIVPGNVYVFGTDAPSVLSADTPHAAQNPLGRIRIEMEAAYRRSGIRTIILRAGDFIDTEASGTWFDKVMITKVRKGRFIYPGDPDVEHAWAWLPDLTVAAAALAEIRADLPIFADIPFAGYTLTGAELCAAISTHLGRPIQLQKMNWLPLQIARPFWKMASPLLEMRYLWNKAHRIDGGKFDALLPDFNFTPPELAIPRALGKL